MLITETVTTKINNTNLDWYVSKGYPFSKETYGCKVDIKVQDLPHKSGVNVDVECDNCEKELKNIPWKNYNKYLHEDGKYYCRLCSMKLFATKKMKKTQFDKSENFHQWCVYNLSKEKSNEILSRWDYKLNYPYTPKTVTRGSNGFDYKGYWFKCLEHPEHDSELKNIKSFTNGHKESFNCKQCNSIGQYLIDLYGENALEMYWDYQKNTLNPWTTDKCGTKRIFIICQNKDYHNSYSVTCASFSSMNSRCPLCCNFNGKVHPIDSLGQYITDTFGKQFLNSIWSDKNNKSPFKYTPFSKSKIWWNCTNNKHEDYKRSICDSNTSDFRCPSCVRERNESFLQEKVRLYLESLGYEILHEHNCTIVPINPKTNHPLPFDNEIVELRLLCEVHGGQHYYISTWHQKLAKKNNTTPEYELHMQKVRDRYKKFISHTKGYYYLEIPYTSDNKKEKYKTLIDNKIRELLILK